MKIHKIKAVCLCLCICFMTACGGNARQESGSANQSAPADTTLRLLQGIWIDEETSLAFCKIEGDSIFYPDTMNVPLRIEATADTLTLIGSETVHYPIDRITKNSLSFHGATGDVVSLRKSEDLNDTIYFTHKVSKPITYNEVVKKDTVVYREGERYRCYIYVNPSKHKVYKQSYTNEGVAVENVYYDNVIHICVYKGKVCLYSRDYSRKSFSNIIPEGFLQQAILSDMKYGFTDKDGFHFNATVCIPDGASCYVTDICVSPDGNVRMELVQ